MSVALAVKLRGNPIGVITDDSAEDAATVARGVVDVLRDPTGVLQTKAGGIVMAWPSAAIESIAVLTPEQAQQMRDARGWGE